MSHTGQNQTNGPLPLAGGCVLAPGERGPIDPKDPHTKAQLDEGKLLRITDTKGKS